MSIKSHWGRILLSGASFAAIGAIGATPAFAQDAGPVSEEIVVTATGRQAAIQDIPVAVTAIGSEQLQNAGVARLTDLEGLAPSFHANVGQSTTAGTVAHIRGIGTGADNPGFESAVGIFIDGVYRARTGVAMSELPELQRVEVLRGPQGTLFGRNTSAGAINIVTAGPEFTQKTWGSGTVGNLGGLSGNIGTNIPLVEDKVALRFDLSARQRDGYIHDLNTGEDINTQDRWSARLQTLFDLTPQSSLRVIVDAAGADEQCCAATPLVYGPTRPAIEAISGASATPPGRVGDFNSQYEDRDFTGTTGRNYGESTDEWGASAQYDNDFGNVDFTSITSYRSWEAHRNQDVDFNKIDIAYRDGMEINFANFSQEMRLHGQAGRLDWLVGGYYGFEKLDTTDRIRLGADFNSYLNFLTIGNTTANPLTPGGPYELLDTQPGPGALDTQPATTDVVRSLFYFGSGFNPGLANVYLTADPTGAGQQRDNWHVNNYNMSIFTHNQFALTDELTFTLGVRYNRDIKEMSANLLATNPTCDSLRGLPVLSGVATGLLATPFASLINLACNPAVNNISNGAYIDRNHETAWSGTTSLAWKPNDDLMMYIGYARGYKAGGYNLDRSGFSVRPDTLNPASLTTGQLVFKPEFTDSVEIGMKSTILGGSTDLNITLFSEGITGYQNNSFNGFNFITRNIPHTESAGVEVDLLARISPNLTINGGIAYDDAHYNSTVVFNTASPAANTIHKGDPLDHAPLWTANGAITWNHNIGASMMLLGYLDARYTSEYRTQTLNREPLGRTDQGAFTMFNGRIGLGAQDQSWALELWGRNLTDEYYFVGAFQAPVQDGTYLVYPNEPRTMGVTLRLRH